MKNKKIVVLVLSFMLAVIFVPSVSFGLENNEAQDSSVASETPVSEAIEKPNGSSKDIDGGIFDGVPWKITNGYDLIIGEEGNQYTFDYSEHFIDEYPWHDYREQLKTVRFDGQVSGNGACRDMFCGCIALTSIDISNFDTSNVDNMYGMFDGCASLTSLDVSTFDTSKVTSTRFMFDECRSLTSLDISDFETSNVTDMRGMFDGCRSLTNLNVCNIDTSNVEEMGIMFQNCSSLESLDVSDLNTSNATDMEEMFKGCTALKTIDISGFDTSKAANLNSMFEGCKSLTSIDASGLKNTNVIETKRMFKGCTVLTDIDLSGFKTSNIHYMDEMFYGCSSLSNVNLTSFNTSNVVGMQSMFSGCSSLTSVDTSSNFNTSQVTDMRNMFAGCGSLTSFDVTGFDTSNAWDMQGIFSGCSSLTSLNMTGFDTSNTWNMQGMFYGCSSLTILDLTSFDTARVRDMSYMFNSCDSLTSLDLSNFDTSNVETMSYMFNSCSSLTSLDATGFDTSNVEDMSEMFSGCSSLTSLDVTGFDTSNVEDMSELFAECSSLTSLDVTSFDTSNVTTMASLFRGCDALTNLDVTGFKTTKVETMSGMFAGCNSLNGINISKFRTSNVEYMNGMFSGCSSLTNIDVSNFNTSNVTAMFNMFEGCSSLTTLDVSNFDTSNVEDMEEMFMGCTQLTTLDLRSFDCSKVTTRKNMFKDCNALTILRVNDWANAGFSGTSKEAHFPVTMFDKEDGTEYAALSKIPKTTGSKSYVSDMSIVIEPDTNEISLFVHLEKIARVKTIYSDDYFTQSSYHYNHDLAHLSLCVELSSWTADVSDWGEDVSDTDVIAKKRYVNIKDAYKKMGFEEPVYYNYGKSLNDSSDKVAFSIAMNKRTGVIAIIIRGGDYGCEWKSNFNVGDGSGDHDGWNAAADEVYQKAKQYIEQQDGTVKMWITGYSRGAAVADLVAKKLNNYADSSSRVDRESIYAYTFATPQGINKGAKPEAKNVFNIVNPGDAVPNVAPSAWKYTRLGTTKLFNYNATYGQTNAVRDNLLGLMDKDVNITANLNQRSAIAGIMDVLKRVYPTASDSQLIQQVLGDFLEYKNTKVMKNNRWVKCSIENYYSILEDRYGDKCFESMQKAFSYLNNTRDGKTVKELVKKTGGEDMVSYVELMYTLCYLHDGDEQDISDLLIKVFKGKNISKVLSAIYSYSPDVGIISNLDDGVEGIAIAHHPEIYLAWMNTPESDVFLSKTAGKKSIVLFQILCPVNVFVYDNSDNLVAEVRNHEVVDATIPVATDTDETTLYLTPSELESYRVQIVPTDNGEMDCTVSELDDDNNVLHKTKYEDISITEGVELESTVTYDEDYQPGQYNLMEGDNEIEPSQEITPCTNDHSWNDGEVTKETTCDTDGVITYTCTVCNDTKTKKIKAPGHSWQHVIDEAGLLKNGSEYDLCEVCGAKDNETIIEGYANYYVKSFKVTKGKKSFTAKWKKQSAKNRKKFNGYQIRYSTELDMSDAKTATASKISKSKKVSKLKSKTKYYVQVRTYTKKNGITFYSKWSSKKSVKTK